MTSRGSLCLCALAALVLLAMPAAATNANNLDQPTYAGEVASILNDNCVSCHRPGQIGPMSLTSYQEARPWARSIGRNVADGRMPPWHAESEHYRFANDRSLTDAERDTILKWVESGAPAGDLAEAPKPPKFQDSEWKLGEPDFVVTLEEVTVPAGGPDQFHDLIGKVALKEDKWIKAVEILPGNSKVVHHVIAIALKGFDVDPAEGWLGAWAAGTDPMVFPEGTARMLPKGSNVVADMHYHPADTEEKDVTRIGLHFADESEVERALANIWVMNQNFRIPAGAKDYEVRASRTFWQAGKIMAFIPHMHYRGTDFTFVAHYPDGKTETLMTVPRWDFNWQTVYELETPVDIPAGTKVECIAHYDNSKDNPVNPDHTIDITFGDESYDEMMIGFIDFVAADSLWPKTPHELRTDKLTALANEMPGKVWKVSGKPEDERSEPHSYAPLLLPREGDGEFWVIWNDQLDNTKVKDLVWKGDEFTAKLASPYGDFDFFGEIKGKKIETTISYGKDKDGNPRQSVWTGELASR